MNCIQTGFLKESGAIFGITARRIIEHKRKKKDIKTSNMVKSGEFSKELISLANQATWKKYKVIKSMHKMNGINWIPSPKESKQMFFENLYQLSKHPNPKAAVESIPESVEQFVSKGS